MQKRRTAPRPAARPRAATRNAKHVYLFDEVRLAERAAGSWEGVRGPARRQGREPRRDDAPGAAGPARIRRHDRGLQCLPRRRRQFPPRHVGAGAGRRSRELERATGKRFGDPREPAARVVPLRREVLDAGHDGHGAQHRPERRRRRRASCELTGDERFVFDAYRRLVQMYGTVVLGVPDEPFEEVLAGYRDAARRARTTRTCRPRTWRRSPASSRRIVAGARAAPVPGRSRSSSCGSPTMAVFRSWNGKRAIDYRNAAGIPHDLGTAVNIVSRWCSATWATTPAPASRRRATSPPARTRSRATS